VAGRRRAEGPAGPTCEPGSARRWSRRSTTRR
jgi:hypothetical protein